MVCSYAAAATSELSYYTGWQLQELIKHKSLIEFLAIFWLALSIYRIIPKKKLDRVGKPRGF
jgi:hypothetical protein